VERFLAFVSSLLIGGCVVAAWLALRHLALQNDLEGLLLSGISIASGVSAHKILGGKESDE
jgi:hypothetical protein